jgi:hypothetical protein
VVQAVVLAAAATFSTLWVLHSLWSVVAGQRAPESLFLGIANTGSTSRGQVGMRHRCEVTVFSHYWVANSSSTPLLFSDKSTDSSTMSDILDRATMLAPAATYGALATASHSGCRALAWWGQPEQCSMRA